MIKRSERCAWAGDEQSMGAPGLKVSYNRALLMRQEKGLPAERSFL